MGIQLSAAWALHLGDKSLLYGSKHTLTPLAIQHLSLTLVLGLFRAQKPLKLLCVCVREEEVREGL